MLPKGVTLRGLEVFEALASTGAVAHAAQRTGLSQPAVSQQIKTLEGALGVSLINHSKRPMRLTSAGESFLARAQAALAQLRSAQTELTEMDLSDISALSLGMIDDFDNTLTPRLVTLLAKSLTRCRFKLVTAPSHEITAAVQDKQLHIAVSASSGAAVQGVREVKLIHDPYILVAPRGVLSGAPRNFDDLGALPFLRYDRAQLVGQQIEGHLARQQVSFPERFEVGSHLALMAMVAQRIGWAITTPLGFMRAERFHPEIEAFALPCEPFGRTIVLYAGEDWSGSVPSDISIAVKRLASELMIEPALVVAPWLRGTFRVLGD